MAIDITLQDPQELLSLVGRKIETILRAEEALNERRAEIGQLLGELQNANLSATSDGSKDESLRCEVDELRTALADRDRTLAELTNTTQVDDEVEHRLVS